MSLAVRIAHPAWASLISSTPDATAADAIASVAYALDARDAHGTERHVDRTHLGRCIHAHRRPGLERIPVPDAEALSSLGARP